MAALGDDTCPRCGGTFHCGIDEVGPCACTTLTLDADTLARLRSRYKGCLCLRCLLALSQNFEEHTGDTP